MADTDSGGRLRNVLHKRHDVLEVLASRSCTKPELIDLVEKSRSTIDRSVDDLKAVDCIECRDGKYHPTTKGRLALAEHTEYTSITGSLDDAGEILNHLPSDCGISSRFLNGVTIHRGNPHVPGAALDKRNELLHSSERMVGLAPTALCSYPETLVDVVRNHSITVEIVIEDAVFHSLSDVRGDQMEALVDHEQIQFHVVEDSLPYALWIMERPEETYVGITVYENGGVQGVLMNDADEAVSWGKSVYQQYRERIAGHDESDEDGVAVVN
ncbi:helix-turn-helix transcriptional regulator [Halorussus pelagicus]|uniref:helix-turn-helix transcriptional regulator n=1 Tax=Halorussus pelagicus TaxID=2505977 RepID=UPI000FFC88BB|nr:hypothetical protein [Halorussus pelagicus]